MKRKDGVYGIRYDPRVLLIVYELFASGTGCGLHSYNEIIVIVRLRNWLWLAHLQ